MIQKIRLSVVVGGMSLLMGTLGAVDTASDAQQSTKTRPVVITFQPNGKRPVFSALDQPFAYFKYDGGKYPLVEICDPRLNQARIILCGTEIAGEPTVMQSSEDLENLTPLRLNTKFADIALQSDKKLPGFREACLAVALEELLTELGLMSDGYRGTLLVDEYQAGYPQKWVLRTCDVHPLVTYLHRNMEEGLVDLSQPKPVLLLELIDKNGQISEQDKKFLDTYYDLVDPLDPEVIAFFSRANKKIDDIREATKTAPNIMDTTGETFMREIESDAGDLDMKKLAVKAALKTVKYGSYAVALYFVYKVILTHPYVQPTYEKFRKEFVV